MAPVALAVAATEACRTSPETGFPQPVFFRPDRIARGSAHDCSYLRAHVRPGLESRGAKPRRSTVKRSLAAHRPALCPAGLVEPGSDGMPSRGICVDGLQWSARRMRRSCSNGLGSESGCRNRAHHVFASRKIRRRRSASRGVLIAIAMLTILCTSLATDWRMVARIKVAAVRHRPTSPPSRPRVAAWLGQRASRPWKRSGRGVRQSLGRSGLPADRTEGCRGSWDSGDAGRC